MRVFCALRHSGGLKAGTPFEIASTPVIAALPEASACSAMKSGTPASSPSPCPLVAAACPGSRDPVASRTSPITISEMTLRMNRYVGAAKIFPDSRTPRRFPSAIRQMKITAIGTRNTCRPGAAAMIAATPADTDTATVST